MAGLTSQAWQERIGQIETVLSFFGATFTIDVARADGEDIYVQGERDGDMVRVEAISNEYLSDRGQLSNAEVARMVELGWDRPEAPDTPNFALLVVNPTETVLHELAVLMARSLAEVYGVRADDEWSIVPTEFGKTAADLFQDPDLFEIFHEGDIVHWGWKSASQYAAVPARFNEVLYAVMSCRLGEVRSAPYRDGRTGALDLPFIAGVQLMGLDGTVFLRATGAELTIWMPYGDPLVLNLPEGDAEAWLNVTRTFALEAADAVIERGAK